MSLSLTTKGRLCRKVGLALTTKGRLCPAHGVALRTKFFDGYLLNRDNFVSFECKATQRVCLEPTMATCDAKAATLGADENVTKTDQQGGTAHLGPQKAKTPYGL